MDGKLIAAVIVLLAVIAGVFIWDTQMDGAAWTDALGYAMIIVMAFLAYWGYSASRR